MWYDSDCLCKCDEMLGSSAQENTGAKRTERTPEGTGVQSSSPDGPWEGATRIIAAFNVINATITVFRGICVELTCDLGMVHTRQFARLFDALMVCEPIITLSHLYGCVVRYHPWVLLRQLAPLKMFCTSTVNLIVSVEHCYFDDSI
jgi:hypothetical protein